MKENKQSHSVLMDVISKNIHEALQKENNNKINNALTNTAEQAQNRCALLEAKVHRMRKFHFFFSMAGDIQCKACGNTYASNVFGAHLKLCQPFRYKDQPLATERLPSFQVYSPFDNIEIQFEGEVWQCV
eukprot:TRINITY_DN13987_c0_g5_i1.p1 TRINITY_DN13987_c0_g5~~TRINITY_DN13987_c0_g5_i1.p1  ORF type:complete len:130 (+),score=8.94 TRINITY_DN13987_c0_g5_i1:155-544(+)